jgi:hypothetical protein
MTKAIIFDLDSCLAAADEVWVVRTGVCGHQTEVTEPICSRGATA